MMTLNVDHNGRWKLHTNRDDMIALRTAITAYNRAGNAQNLPEIPIMKRVQALMDTKAELDVTTGDQP